jgi:hypothetical protein
MSITNVPPKTICQLNPTYPFIVNNTNTVSSSSNSPIISNTSLSTRGDSLLNGIIFTKLSSVGTPNLTTRSSGTVQVLGTPSISSNTLDNAFGVSSNSLWLSGTQNISFYSDSNILPTCVIGSNKITATNTTTNTNLDATVASVFHSLGDALFDSNVLFSNNKAEPSLSTRVIGTKFVFSQRVANTNYENAMGSGGTNNMWITSEGNLAIFCGTALKTSFTPTTTINFSTTKNATLIFDPNVNNTVAQYISGDLGMKNNTVLFLSPTATAPVSSTRTNGSCVVLNNLDTIGLQSNGVYMTTSNSFDIFKDSGSTLQKVSSIGVVSQILDVTSNSLVNINPSVGDILGKKSYTFNSIPITATAIPGMAFDPTKTAFFSIYVNVIVTLTTSSIINAVYKIDGAIIGSDTVYTLQDEDYFDQLNQLSLTWGCASGGQLNVQSTNISDFSSMTLLFRAVTL